MIRLENISKRFGKLQTLKQVSIHFESKSCVALIGPNACGKTTLIKSILGMVIPDSGHIYFKEKSIKNDFLYRQEIGYMPQIGRYPDHMSIGKVLEMIQNIRKKTEYDNELLRTFQIDKMYDKKMHTLSGGTRQKVSAVLAFLFNPDVLILDEPTAGLDPLASEILKDKIIKEKKKGKLILITSHQLSELDDLVTEIVLMQEGNVYFHYPIETLQKQTQEERISKAIAKILKQQQYV